MPLKYRYSAPAWCFLKDEYKPDDFYRGLKAVGYDAAEMVNPEHYHIARSAGLQILNLSAPGMQEGLNNPQNHGKLIPEICTAIEIAAANEIEQVIIFSGNTNNAHGSGFDACAMGIEKLIPIAERNNIVLAFEILNSYDHKGYEACYTKYAFKLADKFASDNFKVLVDIYHLQRMGENPVEVIRQNCTQICHLHIAGSPLRNSPSPEQEIDYPLCLQAASESGYSGYIGMEFLPQGDSLEELANAVKLFDTYR